MNRERIGPFRIEREIGRGGMGTVYLGHDVDLDRPVAIKLLTEDVGSDHRERFLREARAAAAIRHPNVATIYQVGSTEDGVPFIAMEYCAGRTLLEVISLETIDSTRFLRLAIQIAAGLDAAHRNGILHRDIKSANIMVEDDDTVKILDFGLARPFDASTGSSTGSDAATVSRFFGTLPYLSPEQARGKPSGTRSDLFSTGIVLYELATGKLPFRSDNPLELLTKIRSEEPEPFEPRDAVMPPEVAKVIGALLAKKPEDRIQTSAELLRQLEMVYARLHSGEATLPHSVRTARLSRTVRRSRTGPVVIASVVAVAVVMAIAAAYVIFSRRGASGGAGSSADGPIRSMAVLPFAKIQGTKADEFLSVGLADALVTSLQQVRDLRVRPTTAVLKYEGRDEDAKQVASELGVEGVLQGSYISTGDRVRVSLQLTDARTGYSVWARSVEGPRSNLLALIDDVTHETVQALREKLAAGTIRARAEPATTSPAAYEDYLRARSLAGSLLQAQHSEMIKLLSDAITADPDFAAAHAQMAIALSLGRIRGLDDGTYGGHDSVWYARQAVRLQPNLPEAHLALGRALLLEPDRFRESERESLAALRLAPDDPDALFAMISYFVALGELQRSACVIDRYVAIDPTSNSARTRGYFAINAVEPEEARRLAPLAIDNPETRLAGYDILALAELDRGDLAAAQHAMEKARKIAPGHYIPKSLAMLIAAARGNRAEVVRLEKEVEPEATRNHWAALRIAMAWARLGDKRMAMVWIRKAVELGNHSWYFLVKSPWLASLQDDPEYQRMLGKIRQDLDDVHDDVVGVYDLFCGQS